ncbi:hypothetical protein [Priestia megaterium]|uniref:hypothetical protein n=1 Tax=Priestia megaterium TaxID=1404 RepID=UPI0023DBEE83|nr:hypothetical protein [Priestia megaterium]MDF2052656.1 hypothetical protein [Priestia megaterium]MDF2058778.1 hypothetical protein [Priestia megaterium]
MICSYCGTEGSEENCSFCGASLNIQRPKLKEFVVLEDVEKPFNELECFHTYDLLVLLRLVRKERTKAYDLMITLKKAGERPQINQVMVNYSEDLYEPYTKRMNLVRLC